MALIAYIDGPNRDIYLGPDSVGVDLEPMDVYVEMRALRRTDETLRRYPVFLKGFGKVPKGSGKFTERYTREEDGTRIIPYDVTQELTVTGTIITDDGQEGVACFNRAPLSPVTIVDINYIPPQVELIEIDGGSGLSGEETAMLLRIYKAHFNKRSTVGGQSILYEDDKVTPNATFNVTGSTDIEPV